MTRHIIIPDCQVKPGQDLSYLDWISRYIVKHKPDTIINIGDFADMESLSLYDVGKKGFEGRTYKADIEAARTGMIKLTDRIHDERLRLKGGHRKRWKPRMVLTLGNHEHRIDRAVELDRKLDGMMSLDDLQYESYGWEVVPFLEPIVIDGVAYCHYFTSGVMGRPVTSARALLNKKHMSCVAGHQQGRDVAYAIKGDGTRMTAIIAGSAYLHDEGYLNPQTNVHWRGIIVLNEVENGEFDEMFVSLDYLKRKYGGK